MQEKTFDIRLSEIEPGCVLRLILHKLWLVVLAVLTGIMGASLVFSTVSTGTYRCSTDFAVSARTSDGVGNSINTTAASQVVAIYSELLQGRFMQDCINEAGHGELEGTIKATQLDKTCLIKVTVDSPSPRDALLIMQVVLDNYSDLSNYISSTAILVPLNTPNISVAPVGNQNTFVKIILAGGLCGLAVTAALVWISISSGTIQNTEGAKRAVDARLLTALPHEKSSPLHRNPRRRNEARLSILNPSVSFQFVESIHRLAFRLEYEHDKGKRVFLFTSVSEAEGKSSVTANVALSLASRNARVLLIDLDLRRPVQADILRVKVDAQKEFGHLLVNGSSAAEMLESAVVESNTGLHALLSQKSYADQIHYLSSSAISELILLAREQYDYVLLDTPPLGYFTDSELISDYSDGAVLVIRQDLVPAPQINDAIDALSAGKAELLGYVLNDMNYLFSSASPAGYSRYGKYGLYGKYGQHENASSKDKSSRQHSQTHKEGGTL